MNEKCGPCGEHCKCFKRERPHVCEFRPHRLAVGLYVMRCVCGKRKQAPIASAEDFGLTVD